MEKNQNSSLYTSTKEKIKNPTYFNEELEQSLQTEVDIAVLEKTFSVFNDHLSQFITIYKDSLISNLHNAIELFASNKKNAADYLLLAKGLRIITQLIISKAETQSQSISLNPNEGIIIEQESIEQLIKAFSSTDELSTILKKFYKTETDLRLKLKVLLDYEETITKATSRCGLIILDTSLKYSTLVLKQITESLKTFIAIKQFNSNNYSKKERRQNKMLLYDLIFKLEKLSMIVLCFNNSFLIPETDIINQSETSEEWSELKRMLIRIIPSKNNEMKKAVEELKKRFQITTVVLMNGFVSKSSFVNFFTLSGIGIHYLIKNDDAIYDAMKQSINPDPNFPLLICNVTKVGFVKSLTMHSFPKIAFRKKLYLKRLVKEIDTDYIQKMLNFIYGGSDYFASEIAAYSDVFQNNQNLFNSETKKPFELYLEKIDKKDKKHYVSTRLIHNSKITFPKEIPTSFLKFCYSSKPNVTQETLLIHIHGGGFIGTSTLTHENYLRNWVNHLGIPIIGIDYSLSPQHRYPKAIDDIWQAYNWIIKHAEREFNIKLRRIILSGDSAGGTLALALTYLLIVHQARLPDLLLLEYPCCNTSINNMNNSMLLCMEDHLLSFNFLTYINIAYRGNYPNEEDPFLNPVKMPEAFLNQMPKTRFFIGSCDPLRDDSIRLLNRISKTKVDCMCYEFQNHIHGFYALSSNVLTETPSEVLMKEIEQFLKETN